MVDAQFNINLFDAIVYSVLFISAIISLFRGFIREFLSLATWIGAGLVTLTLVDNVIAFLNQYFTSAMAAAIFGTLGTYFLVLLAIGSLSRLLLRYVREGTEVGWVDNVMGLVFGVFKGGLVIVLGFILVTLIFKEEGYPEWIRTASTLPAVQTASIKVVRMMPDYLGSISSLNQPQENIPVDVQNNIVTEQSLGQEIPTAKATQPEPLPGDVGALEQLIRDVTKKQETQPPTEEGYSSWQ